MWAKKQAAGPAQAELLTVGREHHWAQESIEPVMSHVAYKLTKRDIDVLLEFSKGGVLQFISVKTHGLVDASAPNRLRGRIYAVSHYIGTRETKDKRRVAWGILRATDPVGAAKRENEAKHHA